MHKIQNQCEQGHKARRPLVQLFSLGGSTGGSHVQITKDRISRHGTFAGPTRFAEHRSCKYANRNIARQHGHRTRVACGPAWQHEKLSAREGASSLMNGEAGYPRGG